VTVFPRHATALVRLGTEWLLGSLQRQTIWSACRAHVRRRGSERDVIAVNRPRRSVSGGPTERRAPEAAPAAPFAEPCLVVSTTPLLLLNRIEMQPPIPVTIGLTWRHYGLDRTDTQLSSILETAPFLRWIVQTKYSLSIIRLAKSSTGLIDALRSASSKTLLSAFAAPGALAGHRRSGFADEPVAPESLTGALWNPAFEAKRTAQPRLTHVARSFVAAAGRVA
jgi:hypothetical protein